MVLQPIIEDDFNSREKVDLMDYQSFPDGEFKWLLHWQDHLTKHCLLRSLKSKGAKEVAFHFLNQKIHLNQKIWIAKMIFKSINYNKPQLKLKIN